jgi:hypothetical protein
VLLLTSAGHLWQGSVSLRRHSIHASGARLLWQLRQPSCSSSSSSSNSKESSNDALSTQARTITPGVRCSVEHAMLQSSALSKLK